MKIHDRGLHAEKHKPFESIAGTALGRREGVLCAWTAKIEANKQAQE
jgi:hypothetical protein